MRFAGSASIEKNLAYSSQNAKIVNLKVWRSRAGTRESRKGRIKIGAARVGSIYPGHAAKSGPYLTRD